MLAHRDDLRGAAEEAGHSPYLQRTIFRLREVRAVGPVANDKRDKNDRPTAWTQSHRYTTIDRLLKARRTSELDEAQPSSRSTPTASARTHAHR